VCLSSTSLHCPPPLPPFVAGLFIFSLLLSQPRHLFPSQGAAIFPLAPDPSGRTREPRPRRRRAAVSCSRCAEARLPRCALPKGNSHQRQWAAYQGKQLLPPCQPCDKGTDSERGRRSANIAQYCLVAGEKTTTMHGAESDASLSVL